MRLGPCGHTFGNPSSQASPYLCKAARLWESPVQSTRMTASTLPKPPQASIQESLVEKVIVKIPANRFKESALVVGFLEDLSRYLGVAFVPGSMNPGALGSSSPKVGEAAVAAFQLRLSGLRSLVIVQKPWGLLQGIVACPVAFQIPPRGPMSRASSKISCRKCSDTSHSAAVGMCTNSCYLASRVHVLRKRSDTFHLLHSCRAICCQASWLDLDWCSLSCRKTRPDVLVKVKHLQALDKLRFQDHPTTPYLKPRSKLAVGRPYTFTDQPQIVSLKQLSLFVLEVGI